MGLYGKGVGASNRGLAIAALLLGAGMWGLIWYPMRLLEARGLHGLWLTFILYLSALIVSLPWTWRGAPALARMSLPLWILALGAGWTNTAFVLAVLEGNILRVMLLFYLSPIWAVILGWLFLREHVHIRIVATLALAMAGAVGVLWDPAADFPWPRTAADVYAITAGFAFAVSNVAVRKMTSESLAVKAFATWFGVSLVAGGLILLFSAGGPGVGSGVLAAAALLGIGAILTMTLLVQYGVTHMPVHRSAVIMLFELVVGAVSQQWLTNEVMSAREWAGGALIVVAAYLSTRD